MIGGRERIAKYKSDFYRDNYHKMLRGLILMSLINLLLIAAIIYLILFSPSRNYFATTTEGKIIPLVLEKG